MEGQSRVVLVVDDSSDVREYYQRALRRAGYRVVLAGEGERALELVRQIRPDCIVLDVMMPDLDGLGLLERLPEEVPRMPPVVVTSGFDWPEVEALARGARFFLRKPLEPADLVACVKAAIAEEPLEAAEQERISGVSQQKRASARATRDALLARVDFDNPELSAPLGEMVRFLAGWFGFGLCALHLPRGGQMAPHAVAGQPQAAQQLAEDRDATEALGWCASLVDGGSALLIGDASRSPKLAETPAGKASGRFYAAVPVQTHDGLILGALCLLDLQSRTLHSEDLGVLEQCAGALGRRIEAAAAGERPGRTIIEAPGLLTRQGLRVVVDAHLRSARRQRATVELALVDLGGSTPLEGLVEGIQSLIGQRDVALARFADRILAILQRGRAPEALRASTEEVLVHLARLAPIEGAGVVTCEVGDGTTMTAVELERLADEARARATLTGGIERVVLRREPAALHVDGQ